MSKLYFFEDIGPNEAWQIMCEFDASKKGPRCDNCDSGGTTTTKPMRRGDRHVDLFKALLNLGSQDSKMMSSHCLGNSS